MPQLPSGESTLCDLASRVPSVVVSNSVGVSYESQATVVETVIPGHEALASVAQTSSPSWEALASARRAAGLVP